MADDWRRGHKLEDLVNYQVDDQTLKRIINRIVRILIQNPFILQDCPRVANEDTLDPSCPYYINAPIFMDCSLIANFFGPFTNEEIAALMGCGPKEIQRLVSSGIKKMRKRMKKGDFT